MADFLHTMVRITDPEKSRAFYEALAFRFSRDMDIVRSGELEARTTSSRSATPRTSSS
jgi:catechol 2,3-dioxygenase-like lactoylglutathione lyase family enzyme